MSNMFLSLKRVSKPCANSGFFYESIYVTW